MQYPKSSPTRPCSPRRRLLNAKSFDHAITGTIGIESHSFVQLKILKHSLWLLQGIYGESPPPFSNPSAAAAWWERLRLVRAACLALFYNPNITSTQNSVLNQAEGRCLVQTVLREFSKQRENLCLAVGDRVIFFRSGNWYPAHVTQQESDGSGYKLNFEGSEAFDRLWVKPWDPRLRKEIFFDGEAGSKALLQTGSFAKLGDRVQLSLVDVLEMGFYTSLNTRPVGTVTESVPGKDLVLVDLVKPCGLEKVFTRNTNVTIISEKCYKAEAEKILNLRHRAVEWLRCAVVSETPFLLRSLVYRISNQRALCSFTLHQNTLIVNLLDVLGGRRLRVCIAEKDLVGCLANISLRNTVNCSGEWREAFCLRVAQRLRVKGGTLTFVDGAFQDSMMISAKLMETFYLLGQTRVKVTFRRVNSRISISITPVFNDIDQCPVYHIQLDPEEWSVLEYGRLDWLLSEDSESLCKNILSLLKIKNGYPFFKLRSCIKQCDEYVHFEPPKKEKPTYDELMEAGMYRHVYQASMKAKNEYRVFWRRISVLKGCDLKPSGRYFITARLADDGQAIYFHFLHMEKGSATLKLGFREWAKYGYGPLLWMSKEQKVFMCELVCYWVAVNPEKGECRLEEEVVRREFSKRDFILRWFGERRRISIHDKGDRLQIVATAKGVPGNWDFEVNKEVWEEHTRLSDLLWMPVQQRACLAHRMIWQVVLESSPPRAYVDCSIPVLFWKAGCHLLRKGRCFISAYDVGRSVVILVKNCHGEQVTMTHVTPEDWLEVMGIKMTPFFWFCGRLRPHIPPEPLAEHVIRLAKVGVISLSERFYKKRIEEKIWATERGDAPPEYPIFDVGAVMPPKENPMKRAVKRMAMLRQMSASAGLGSAPPPKPTIFAPAEFADDWSNDELADDLRCLCCGLERGEGHGKTCKHKFGVCRPCKIKASLQQRKAGTQKIMSLIRKEKESEAAARQMLKLEDELAYTYREQTKREKKETTLLSEEDFISTVMRIKNKFGQHFSTISVQPERVACPTDEMCTKKMGLEDNSPCQVEEPDDDDFYCDLCQEQIKIYTEGRFNCTVCDDYDICFKCSCFVKESFKNGITFHHPSHKFVHLVAKKEDRMIEPLVISVIPEKYKHLFLSFEGEFQNGKENRRQSIAGEPLPTLKITKFDQIVNEPQRNRARSLPTYSDMKPFKSSDISLNATFNQSTDLPPPVAPMS